MLELITGIFGGPIVGVIGSVVSGFVGYFEKQQQIAADKVRYNHEARLLEMNISAKAVEMENEAAIASMNTDSANLLASYQHDAFEGAGKPYRWVASVLRLVRPVLTVGLIVLVAYIVIAKVDGVTLDTVAAKILFLAEIALAWWFADRRRAAANQ